MTIPEGVTRIEPGVFSDCTSLASITIPESVTRIGQAAFSNCTHLTSITIPESVTTIGRSVFSNCTNLTSITILEGVTSIGEYAFSRCKSLASITIPESVTSIGEDAFCDCPNLTSITLPDSATSTEDSAKMLLDARREIIDYDAYSRGTTGEEIWEDMYIESDGEDSIISIKEVPLKALLTYGAIQHIKLEEAPNSSRALIAKRLKTLNKDSRTFYKNPERITYVVSCDDFLFVQGGVDYDDFLFVQGGVDYADGREYPYFGVLLHNSGELLVKDFHEFVEVLLIEGTYFLLTYWQEPECGKRGVIIYQLCVRQNTDSSLVKILGDYSSST